MIPEAIAVAVLITGSAYLAAYAIWARRRIEHLEGQVQELTNVVGDSVAAAYVWHEERQELIAKLFAQQPGLASQTGAALLHKGDAD